MKTTQREALRIIREYLLHKGKGPSVREIRDEMGYKSPRSVSLIISELMEAGYLTRDDNKELKLTKREGTLNSVAETVNIPVVGQVACGTPILAEENIDAHIPVSTKLAKPSGKYYFLRARGDSMDKKGINNDDLVLIRQQDMAEPGESVVALIDDEATIKEFSLSNGVVVLKPSSKNPDHKPIILDEDFRIQGVVVKSFSNL